MSFKSVTYLENLSLSGWTSIYGISINVKQTLLLKEEHHDGEHTQEDEEGDGGENITRG